MTFMGQGTWIDDLLVGMKRELEERVRTTDAMAAELKRQLAVCQDVNGILRDQVAGQTTLRDVIEGPEIDEVRDLRLRLEASEALNATQRVVIDNLDARILGAEKAYTHLHESIIRERAAMRDQADDEVRKAVSEQVVQSSETIAELREELALCQIENERLQEQIEASKMAAKDPMPNPTPTLGDPGEDIERVCRPEGEIGLTDQSEHVEQGR